MFRAGDVDAPSRVAARCQTKYCACNKKGADPRPLKFLIHMQYLLCIMSQSAARTRETPGERMKGREYRRFEANKKYFLHRKADTAQTQPGKVPAQYDERHWREYSTMTLIAGCYQTTVEISVLGTVEGVREEYETQDGVQEAQTVDCRRGGHHGGCGHHHSPGGRGVTVQGEKRAVGYNGRGRGCSAQIPIWPGHIGVKAVQDMTATEGRDIRQSAGGGGHGTDTGALYQT